MLLTLLVLGAALVRSVGAPSSAPAETTAWANRVELDLVLHDTADRAGLDGVHEPVTGQALPCVRNDGRDGFSYFLQTIRAPGRADAAGFLDSVAEHWRGLGYAVDTSDPGVVMALTSDGAVLEAAASEVGVRLAGETLCALRDGAPEAGEEDPCPPPSSSSRCPQHRRARPYLSARTAARCGRRWSRMRARDVGRARGRVVIGGVVGGSAALGRVA